MEQYFRTQKMILACRMYYYYNKSQSEIAKELEISRPFVSKLLSEARDSGIVTILIKDPLQSETIHEKAIRSRYGIKRIIVAREENKGNRLLSVCLTACKYLDYILKPGCVIGIGSGATMNLCAQNVITRNDLDGLSVVQLDSECRKIKHTTYPQEITRAFSKAFEAVPYIMPLPIMFNCKETKDAVFEDPCIRQIKALQELSNIAMFSVAPIARGNAFNLCRQGHVDDDKIKELSWKGARGALFNRIFDKDGFVCDEDLDERTTSITLDKLREKEYKIGVVSGREKIDCTIAALRGGYINVLITDEDVAEGLI